MGTKVCGLQPRKIRIYEFSTFFNVVVEGGVAKIMQ
jgi:hypothetical protein